jgi:hypothetical protein
MKILFFGDQLLRVAVDIFGCLRYLEIFVALHKTSRDRYVCNICNERGQGWTRIENTGGAPDGRRVRIYGHPG